ncbi:NAD(P)-dependent oxidoreductase [Bradyrhizobium sp. WSM1253]|uniref:NAD-dependent epimerase/dehydratase family protein n=1 Tax=Bradyrhizobium sp. WSM1253 TaxID=319003 RepID=UPI00025D26D3|nr:NAD(P)-dependent oxidoreductase [Bradyrhizobium sp. WSM1253]EIG62343.1 nucleoside-diphosphate-sugar epimerase [Bradyrhizobium sp. WSM1253]
MKVLVTGATGFVGRHVVSALLARGHSVAAVARNAEKARSLPWFTQVHFISCDLHRDFRPTLSGESQPDALIHLAWPGLPNYRDFFHLGRNLPADLAFLEAAVDAGVSQIMVAGTCLEYGMQYGPLTEQGATAPITAYGFAKDSLRKSLQFLQQPKPFTLQWMRLFYMYGEGQNPNSVLAQLDRAIDEDAAFFNMSAGDQLRDYLPINAVAANFALALENPLVCDGVINCCSGAPISVLDLVSQHRISRSSEIELRRRHFPYPDYEPMAFWGVPSKLNTLKPSSR